MTTGERIKAARVAAGLTQAELSSKLEVPFQSVSQWERGTRNPKLATIKRIAKALGITVAELMGLSDVENIITKDFFVSHKMEDIPVNFYEMFIELCKMRGAAPSTIADKAGLDKSVVSYWKKHPRAKIKLETLQRIANALKVPVYSFITGDITKGINTDLEGNVGNPKIFYECDRCSCDRCNPSCHHTANIRHAKNFHIVYTDHDGVSVFSEGEYD